MKALGFILQLVLCAAALQAQEQDTSSIRDTSRVRGFVIADPGIALRKAIILFPPSLQHDGRFESFQFLDTPSGMPPPLLNRVFTQKADLLSPYLLQLQQESQAGSLHVVLGAAGLGGAAYLAYRHIKKYGFP
jgi:hypothetical protein